MTGIVAIASRTTSLLFVLLVAAMAALFAWAVLVKPGQGPLADRRGRWVAVTGLILVAYLAVPGVLAARGLLDRYNPLPAPAMVMIGALSLATVILAYSPLGTRLVAAIPMTGLVGYQVFRVPVEFLLHRLHVEGVVPVQMTYLGRNLDILTGITAGILALYLRTGRRPPRLVLAWNLMGLALLVNIMTIAILSTPVSFRQFTDSPPHILPSTFPFVWLPTWLVQAALFGHLLVIRKLARTRGHAPATASP